MLPDASLLRVGPPRIRPNVSELVAGRNATVQLACTGAYPLDWLYPPGDAPRVALTSVSCPTCPRSLRYESLLRTERLESGDTGLYRCVYSRRLDIISNETSDGIYVYVKSECHPVSFLQAGSTVGKVHSLHPVQCLKSGKACLA